MSTPADAGSRRCRKKGEGAEEMCRFPASVSGHTENIPMTVILYLRWGATEQGLIGADIFVYVSPVYFGQFDTFRRRKEWLFLKEQVWRW